MFTEEQNPAPETPATAETPTPEAAPAEAMPATTEPAQETKAPAEPKKPTSKVPADERALAAAGYFPMLFVFQLIMKPKSTFCQMHAKQGVLLTGLSVLVMFILLIMPALGSLLFLGLLAVIAIGAFQAYSGVEWKIPILWDFASKINVVQFFAVTPAPPKKEEAPAKKEPAEAAPEAAPAEPELTPPPATPES